MSDLRVPATDANHVVAFVEGHEADVEIVWLRGRIDAPGRFDDLDSALDSIEAAVSGTAPPTRVVTI